MANYNDVVLVSKSKLDALSTVIQNKAHISTPLDIDLMIWYIGQLFAQTVSTTDLQIVANNGVSSYSETDTKVLITKAKLNDLANAIQEKFSITTPLTLDLMVSYAELLYKQIDSTLGMQFKPNDDLTGFWVIGYLGTETENVLISDYHEGKPIIGISSFNPSKSIKNLTIGDNVTTISGSSFSASNVENIVIGKGITSIEAYAFAESKLVTITIKNKVSFMGRYVFDECDNLTDIYVPWAVGEVSGAPWGAPSTTTIHYNSAV